MSALNRNQNEPQWVYVTIALLVFVTNMFSNQPREMTTTVSQGRIVTLPIADGEILCQVCKTALEQPRRVA